MACLVHRSSRFTLDVLLRRAALIVEDDNPLGGTGEVGYNEADPWIKRAYPLNAHTHKM